MAAGRRGLQTRQYCCMSSSNSPCCLFPPALNLEMAIGASCLAFGPNGSLYLACEKFPDLLIIPPSGKPQRKRLEGVVQKNGQADVDIEAMCIFKGNIYLMDEDNLVIYSTPLDNPGPVRTLTIQHHGLINKESVDDNRSNLASIEGLVVTDTFHGP